MRTPLVITLILGLGLLVGYEGLSAGSFVFVEGLDTSAPVQGPRPELGVSYTDPRYKTRVTRVSDAVQAQDIYPPQWIRHEYSRRPAFNADSSKVLMLSSNGWWRLYTVNRPSNSLSFVRTLNVGGSIEPNWNKSHPDRFYHFSNYGQGLKIFEYDIRNQQSLVVRDLENKVKALFPSASGVWTKEEGRPSDDQQTWCLIVQDATHQALGLIAYRFDSNQILGHLALSDGDTPDHISTSPDGSRCVPSWTSSKGTRAYTLDFAEFVQLHPTSTHSDLATDAAGRNVYVHFDYQAGQLIMVDLHSGARTELLNLYGANHSAVAGHVSGLAAAKRGYVVVSFYACTEEYGAKPCDPARQWFYNKVVIVQLKPRPKVYNLAHTHYRDSGYWGETQATTNRDLSLVLFASSWDSPKESEISSYMIEVPADKLP